MRFFTLSSLILLLLLLVFSFHCDEAVVAAQKQGIGGRSDGNGQRRSNSGWDLPGNKQRGKSKGGKSGRN